MTQAQPEPTGVSAPPALVPEAPPASGACDAAYPELCLPSGAADLDCGQITARRFTVYPPDPHGFDRDADGIGCDSG